MFASLITRLPHGNSDQNIQLFIDTYVHILYIFLSLAFCLLPSRNITGENSVQSAESSSNHVTRNNLEKISKSTKNTDTPSTRTKQAFIVQFDRVHISELF